MTRTLCPEMDQWLERKQATPLPAPAPEWLTPSEVIPPCPLNDREFAWLWDRYVRCSFPPATAAKRLAKTPLANLTLRGRNFAVRISHRFRRQILGKPAVRMTPDEFLDRVRQCATAPACPKCNHSANFVRIRYF